MMRPLAGELNVPEWGARACWKRTSGNNAFCLTVTLDLDRGLSYISATDCVGAKAPMRMGV
jgi:hypothetical protein